MQETTYYKYTKLINHVRYNAIKNKLTKKIVRTPRELIK